MPTLRILTNVTVPAEQRASLLARASHTVAGMLSKPESYPIFSRFRRPPAPKPRFSAAMGRAVHSGSST